MKYRLEIDTTNIPDQLTQNRFPTKLTALANILSTTLRDLRSFALVIVHEPKGLCWCRCCNSQVSEKFFANIIDALPTTCKSLYLDTGGSDKPGDWKISNAVRRMMPRLQHLWLRARTLSTTFFLSDPNVKDQDVSTLEMQAFNYWNSHQGAFWNDYGEDDWTFGDAELIAFRAWRREPANIRQQWLDDTAMLTRNEAFEVPPYPDLRSLTPLGIFPALETCTVITGDIEQIKSAEHHMLLQDGYNPDPPFFPITTLLVWDVIDGRTDILPMLPDKRERDFPRTDIGNAELHLLHDRHGTIYHGSSQQLVRAVDMLYGAQWQTANDGLLVPRTMFPAIERGAVQLTSPKTVIGRIQQEEYGVDMYLQAWFARAYNMPEVLSRCEAYAAKNAMRPSSGRLSRREFEQVLLYYDIVGRSRSTHQFHAHIQQLFDAADWEEEV
ncbi:hypothetical protein OHC33_007936 [Knufia fluminis]|uniref:Uncharacterized protein n=1 Tax=Knufia fluminis TaxID=191047 RepID=A0AAN8EBM8_9EURO|nr:hypothetical protein OHC33_007936 [Knufia fluminis]